MCIVTGDELQVTSGAGFPQEPRAYLQVSRHLPRRLRSPRWVRGVCRDVCAACAGSAAFSGTFAQPAQVSRHLPRRLHSPRKSCGIFRDVCAARASLAAFAGTFAQPALGPRRLPGRLRSPRKSCGICRGVCAACAGFRGIFRDVCAGFRGINRKKRGNRPDLERLPLLIPSVTCNP